MANENRRWVTPEEWYAGLDSQTRAHADKLLAILKRFGASKPLEWVSSEMRENIPQVARFLILRQIRNVMDTLPFGDLDVARKSSAAIEKTLNLSIIMRDGREAFQRLVDSGANADDIVRVARTVNVQSVLT